MEHACTCGASVDAFGTHGLSCRRSGGHIPRHAAVNETTRCALVCAVMMVKGQMA